MLQVGGPCIGKRRRKIQGVPPIVVAWDMWQSNGTSRKQLSRCHHGPDLKNTSMFKLALVYRYHIEPMPIYDLWVPISTKFFKHIILLYEGFPTQYLPRRWAMVKRDLFRVRARFKKKTSRLAGWLLPHLCAHMKIASFPKIDFLLDWGKGCPCNTKKTQRSDSVVGCMGVWYNCTQPFWCFFASASHHPSSP